MQHTVQTLFVKYSCRYHSHHHHDQQNHPHHHNIALPATTHCTNSLVVVILIIAVTIKIIVIVIRFAFESLQKFCIWSVEIYKMQDFCKTSAGTTNL